MRKHPLACVLLFAVSGVAYAQSSVLLYGVLDEGIQFNNNASGKRQYYLASGELNGSR